MAAGAGDVRSGSTPPAARERKGAASRPTRNIPRHATSPRTGASTPPTMPLTPAMRPLAIHRRDAERPMSAPPTMAENGVNPSIVRILLVQDRRQHKRVRRVPSGSAARVRSEEHTSDLQSLL